MDQQKLDELRESLLFLHVAELREIAANLALSDKGKKGLVIDRIIYFLRTGEKIATPNFPQISCANRGLSYSIGPKELMLKGAYTNDLKTRVFFKGQIGPHFHFTAFGIDWLNERWMAGKPPTYEEFAKMWEGENQRRKQNPKHPKDEWAYIRFTQSYLRQFPKASREAIIQAWEEARAQHKRRASEILNRLFQNKHDHSSQSDPKILRK